MPTRARGPRLLRLAFALVAVATASSPMLAQAQTRFVPYYGKNQIRYTKFDWHIYTTEHFEIYYYPEEEQHLERLQATVAGLPPATRNELSQLLALLDLAPSRLALTGLRQGWAAAGAAASASRTAKGTMYMDCLLRPL